MPEPTTTPGIAWVHFMSLQADKPVPYSGLTEFASDVWKEVIRRWVELDFSDEGWTERGEGVCNDRVRQLGEQIYRQTNSTASLLTVAQDVRVRLSRTDSRLAICFASDINAAWDGIGEWPSRDWF